MEESTTALRQLQAANSQLTETNQRLQQDKADAAASRPGTETGKTPEGSVQSSIIANLQRDNARLNDEVKRATRELLSLNQQVRTLHSQSSGAPASVTEHANADELAQLTAKAQQAAADAGRLETENRRLTARIAVLEALPKPSVDGSASGKLAEAQQSAADLGKQIATLRAEKAELEKWSRSLETNVNEQSAAAKLADSKQAALQQQLAQAQEQLTERMADLAAQKEANVKLAAENKNLDGRLTKVQKDLKSASDRTVDTAELDRVRHQLTETVAQLTVLEQQNQATAGQLVLGDGCRQGRPSPRDPARTGSRRRADGLGRRHEAHGFPQSGERPGIRSPK
ncbi:MAG: hypothetical protein WDM96_03880 [Lacunisphaera sp.]